MVGIRVGRASARRSPPLGLSKKVRRGGGEQRRVCQAHGARMVDSVELQGTEPRSGSHPPFYAWYVRGHC